MNVQLPTLAPNPIQPPCRPAAQTPQPVGARRERHPRDFGVGYGSSSGYACDRHYLDRTPASRFRCA